MFGGIGSVGRAFNTGLNIGVGKGLNGAIGGYGAMAFGAGLGASVGASTSIMSDGTVNPATGAAVGAVVGAAALPVAGLAVGALGNATVGAAKAAPAVGSAVGSGAVKAAPYIGAVGAKIATDAASTVWGIGSKLIDFKDGAEKLSQVKLTGTISGIKQGIKNGENALQKTIGGVSGAVINGKSLLALTAFTEGAKQAFRSTETAKMGTMTGVVRPTPSTPSYANMAGATGDLVFALNANKRG